MYTDSAANWNLFLKNKFPLLCPTSFITDFPQNSIHSFLRAMFQEIRSSLTLDETLTEFKAIIDVNKKLNLHKFRLLRLQINIDVEWL